MSIKILLFEVICISLMNGVKSNITIRYYIEK
jgi:hypothetical protein